MGVHINDFKASTLSPFGCIPMEEEIALLAGVGVGVSLGGRSRGDGDSDQNRSFVDD